MRMPLKRGITTLLSAGLFFLSSSDTLMRERQAKRQHEQQNQEREYSLFYSQYLSNYTCAHEAIYDIATSRHLSINSQRTLYNHLNLSETYRIRCEELCKTGLVTSTDQLIWTAQDSNILFLLSANLYGYDGIPPTLQKYLNNRDYHITVEGIKSDAELQTLKEGIITSFKLISAGGMQGR